MHKLKAGTANYILITITISLKQNTKQVVKIQVFLYPLGYEIGRDTCFYSRPLQSTGSHFAAFQIVQHNTQMTLVANSRPLGVLTHVLLTEINEKLVLRSS